MFESESGGGREIAAHAARCSRVGFAPTPRDAPFRAARTSRCITRDRARRSTIGHRGALLEPISKSFEEDNEAGKLAKAEEIVGIRSPDRSGLAQRAAQAGLRACPTIARRNRTLRLSLAPRFRNISGPAIFGAFGQVLIIGSDVKHVLFRDRIDHLLRHGARFLRTLAPVLWIIQMRGWHDARPL